MSLDVVRNMLGEQRKRLVASILGFMESEDWWGELHDDEREQLRAKVRGAIGVYHDVTLDLLKATLGGSQVLMSEDALRLLQSTHDGLVDLARKLEG